MFRVLVFVSVMLCSVSVEARQRYVRRYQQPQQTCRNGVCSVQRPVVTTTVPTNQLVTTQAVVQHPQVSIAQRKANIQASRGMCYHPGGSFGGGRYEGCGVSSRSADAAIRNCCYYGQKTPIDIGVARAANGYYYATVIYR